MGQGTAQNCTEQMDSRQRRRPNYGGRCRQWDGSSTGRNNIEALKKYFCSEYAYFTHGGRYYCMTATEAARYDQEAGGTL